MEMEWLLYLEKLESLWKKAKERDVIKHLLMIPDLICRPRRFWRDYKLLPRRDKVIQFMIYGALFALTIWLVSNEKLSIGSLAKIITMEIAALFMYVVIISLANMIVKQEWTGLWFFVIFCCYMKFIFTIPELLALRSYYIFESPLLVAVAAFIPAVVELILIVVSAYVWQMKRSKMIWAIFLSVLFLNIYDALFIVTGWPRSTNQNLTNKIMIERKELGKSIKNAYDIPTYVVSRDKSDLVWYLYSTPIDTVARKKYDDTEQFIAELKEDLDSLKAVSSRSRFKTNKVFFDQMYSLKRSIKYVYETRMYEESPIIQQFDVVMDSVVIDRFYHREFNKEIKEMNDELLRQEIREVEQFNTAVSVNHLGLLWHPVLLIHYVYSNMIE